MKKIVSFIAAVAALGSVSTAFSQVKENKEVTHMGGGVVANQNTSYSPTVTQLGGNVVEYREYTPELSLSLLGVSAAVGYESEYVFRGEKRSGHAIQPKVEFSYPLYALDLYAGAWYSSPIKGTSVGEMSELDAYVGAVYYYKDMRVDVGYIYYWYPDSASSLISGDMEVYGGISFDTASYMFGVNLSPSFYYFYNWTLEQHVFEMSLGYAFPVGEWIWNYGSITLPVRVYGGYLTAGKKDDGKLGGQGCNYWYYGVSADVAYAVTEYCTISAGVRFSQRGGGEGPQSDGSYELMGREKNFWFGGKVDFGF